ncbi:hypothetical protein BDQ12DRAFT_687383, partial [Crucibulum laeve]
MDSGHSSFVSTSATSFFILKLQALSTIMNSFSCLVSVLYCVAAFICVHTSPASLFRPSLLSAQLLKPRLR